MFAHFNPYSVYKGFYGIKNGTLQIASLIPKFLVPLPRRLAVTFDLKVYCIHLGQV